MWPDGPLPEPGSRPSVPGVRRRMLYQSQLLAEQIRGMIAKSALDEGDRLTTEQDLIETTGYSRATVREALRILASEGLIRTRPGPNGGVFVARPGNDRVTHSLGLVLEASRVDMGSLLEARVELESSAARLAAIRVTDDEIRELKASCARFVTGLEKGDWDACVEENLHFHIKVVEASKNDVMILLHSAIRDLIRISTFEPVFSVQAQQDVAAAHQRIVEALEQHDPDLASRRVRKHLAAFEEYLRETGQYVILQRKFRISGTNV